ncbi:DMP19 family protein [Microbulbifer agarilyticus]|uniref:DMP19 family protein n=1 Tax=Microbulbifer agarilyticus TaxID=260552 RepID=UPI001C961619|nr:DMP19 family protein [Microbulbifer agarilyticus]MBY6189328.1 DMP19 family protein [Microbulbifer agarilyticus]
MNIEQVFEESLAEVEAKGFDSVNEPIRVLATIWAVEAEVNNGGFDQLFHNSAGDIAHYAAIAFNSIGALKMASISQKALDIFGEGGPPKNRNARIAALEAMPEEYEERLNELDEEFFEYPDNVQNLVSSYVESNF